MGNVGYVLTLLLVLGVVVQGQGECRRPPLWMFSLPDDIEPIFSGLTAPLVLVNNGTILSLISQPDPAVARLFFLDEDVAEFPVVMCIFSDDFNEINYSLATTSFDPTILVGSTSIPTTGVITSRPFRFRALFNCIASSNRDSIIIEVAINTSRGSEEFCQTVFYVSKRCGDPGMETMSLGIMDGFLSQNFSFKAPPTETLPIVTKVVPPTVNTHVTVTLPAVLVPLFLAVLFALLVVLVVWIVWYRRKKKEVAEFHPESVGMAYQGVYMKWTKRGPHDKEIPRENIHLVRELGEGAFGVVYQGAAEGIEPSVPGEFTSTDVAVKQLREGSNEVDDFFREVNFMSKLDHPNIVKLIGVCSLEEPFSMIFEYMDLGDLCGFLRQAIGLGASQEDLQDDDDTQEPLLTKNELLSIATQVAEGMVYISGLGLVHRDLATRNCLVATGLVVKIGDFGMSRSVNDSDYYRVKGQALLPVRWMSPESILYGKFTMETDVWAYGILVWEVFTFGQQPYSGLANEEVIKTIQKGGHPEPPDNCSASNLMLKCWEKTPKKRPSFESIISALGELLENEDEGND